MPTDARTEPSTTFLTRLVMIVAVVALAAFFWFASEVIVIALVGVVMACAIRAMAVPVARWLNLPERAVVVVVLVLLVLLFVLGSWLFGNRIATEMSELLRRLPAAVARMRTWLADSALGQMLLDALAGGGASAASYLGNLTTVAKGTVGAVTNLLLVIFLALYFALEPKLYVDGLLRLLPPRLRPRWRSALDHSAEALRKWLGGQAIAMFSVGLLMTIGLFLLGVPLPLALGVLAGVLDFVPLVGPLIAAVAAVLIAFGESPATALYTALLFMAVQQVEGHLILPLAQRWAVELPPAVGLLAIVVFGTLFGIPGILIATPLVVVLITLVHDLYVKDVLEAPGPVDRDDRVRTDTGKA